MAGRAPVAGGSDIVEAAIDRLRARGQRVTLARRVVLDVLARVGDDHPTAEQVYERVAETHPAIHLATVYRTLDTLRGLGLIEHTHLAHGPAVYRLANDRHEHAVCETCGVVVHVDAGAMRSFEQRLQRVHGFRLGPQHFALTGECERCSTSGD